MKKNILKSGLVALTISTSLVSGTAMAMGTKSPVFDYIPQDTLVFLGNTKSFSYKDYMKSMDPAMFNPGDDEAIQDLFENESDKRSLFFKALWLDYLNVIKDPTNLVDHYGFKDQAQVAFYTNDMVPVAKFSIANKDAFLNILTKAEEESGFKAEEKTVDGQTYKSYLLSDSDEVPVSLLVGSSDEWLTVAFAPVATSEDELREIFGLKKVANNLNESSKLDDMIAEYGFDGYSLGFFNHQEVAKMMTNKTAPVFMTQEDWDRNSDMKNEACAADLAKITATWPQTVFGSTKTEYTETGMSNIVRTVVEIKDADIASTLQSLNGHLPSHLSSEGQMLSFGLGVDVNNFTPAVTKLWQMATSATYTCEPLVELQDNIKQSNPGMVSMFAGMANGLKGVSISVNSLDLDFSMPHQPMPKSVDMIFSAASSNPSMIFSVLSMVNPALRGIQVPTDGSELKLNDKAPELNMLGGDVMAAIKGQHLNAYIGEKSKAISEASADHNIDSNGFMQFFMDYGPVFKLMGEQMKAQGEEIPAQFEAYTNMNMQADNLTVFTEKGIENITEVNLKK